MYVLDRWAPRDLRAVRDLKDHREVWVPKDSRDLQRIQGPRGIRVLRELKVTKVRQESQVHMVQRAVLQGPKELKA
jgi:ABC-type metal ion transport system substrate-binding protein